MKVYSWKKTRVMAKTTPKEAIKSSRSLVHQSPQFSNVSFTSKVLQQCYYSSAVLRTLARKRQKRLKTTITKAIIEEKRKILKFIFPVLPDLINE